MTEFRRIVHTPGSRVWFWQIYGYIQGKASINNEWAELYDVYTRMIGVSEWEDNPSETTVGLTAGPKTE